MKKAKHKCPQMAGNLLAFIAFAFLARLSNSDTLITHFPEKWSHVNEDDRFFLQREEKVGLWGFFFFFFAAFCCLKWIILESVRVWVGQRVCEDSGGGQGSLTFRTSVLKWRWGKIHGALSLLDLKCNPVWNNVSLTETVVNCSRLLPSARPYKGKQH